MKLFGQAIGTIAYADLKEFCDDGVPENICLDYKKALSPKHTTLQIAKLASAFSNSLGGLILFGVDEVQDAAGRGVPSDLAGVLKADYVEKKIKSTCLDSVVPPVLVETISFDHPTDPDREFVVARIPESEASPHYLRDSGRVYVRCDDISHKLKSDDEGREASPDEIEWLLNRRRKPVELRERLLNRALSRCPEQTGERRLLSISIIPLYPRHELWPLSDLKRTMAELALTRDGNVKFASDSVYLLTQESLPNSPWSYFSYAELNKFGLLFFANEAKELDRRGQDNFQNGIDGLAFLHHLRLLVRAASKLYSDVSYWGLVQIRVTADYVIGLKLLLRFPGGDKFFGQCIDRDFSFERTILAGQLENESLVQDLFQEFSWCLGDGDVKREDFQQYLELIKKHWPYLKTRI